MGVAILMSIVPNFVSKLYQTCFKNKSNVGQLSEISLMSGLLKEKVKQLQNIVEMKKSGNCQVYQQS